MQLHLKYSIEMFYSNAPVSTSTALRSASTPNKDTISTPLRHRLHDHPRPAVTTRNMLQQHDGCCSML